MFYEQNTFAINCVNQVLGVMQGFPEIPQPSQFLRTWCVHENVERVVTLAQEVRCAAAHDHAIATLRNVLHHMFAHFHHAVRAKGLMFKVCAAFIAAAPEDFHQALKGAVHTLFAHGN